MGLDHPPHARVGFGIRKEETGSRRTRVRALTLQTNPLMESMEGKDCCTLEMDERAGNSNAQSSDLGGGDAINQMQAWKERDGFKRSWHGAEEGGEQIMSSLLVLLCLNTRGTFRSGTDPAFVGPEAPTVESPL